MKVTVFVSYCHDDISPDEGRMRALIDALSASGAGTYDLLVDYRHEAAAVGANISEFMERIHSADAAVLLLTPGYKERVARKAGTGVYTEFRRIYDRYLAAQEKNTYGRSFLVIPIVFAGSFVDACPTELRQLVCADATWLQVVPDSLPPKLRREVRIRLSNLVKEISARIAGVAATKGHLYRDRQERLFRHFLFDDSKSRWDRPENIDYLESAFVKTSTFLRVRNREASFIIGRKGSGKSTITHVLPLFIVPPPEIVLRLEFEHLPFDACFNILSARPAEESDLRHLLGPLFSYQLIWDAFLHLAFAYSVRQQLSERSDLRRTLRRLVDRPLAASRDPAEKAAMSTKALFVYAFERIVGYVESIVRRPRQEGSVAEVIADFHPSAVRRHVLGKGGWERLEEILDEYQTSGERILITADGFDAMVGYFSLASDRSVDARRFERELLLTLFQVVLNRGPARIGGGRLYEISDYCVAVPHDRFTEARVWDRDTYQYRNRVAPITWSGVELSALVRKRLALLRSVPDPKGQALEERLRLVMKKGFPELPDDIAFQFGAANYRIPLFLYVLRHTLWRPRDVLYYYASLLAASDEFRTKRVETPSGFVRQVIAGATHQIVKDELLAEYASTFRNLREVLRAFRQAPQVVSWKELEMRLDRFRFDTDLRPDEVPSLEWKVEVLYDLGVLGVILDRKRSERFSAFRHAFVFNEDQLLSDKLGRDNYRDCEFALHPVLCEYLNLDTSKNLELILPLDWDYLHPNEVLRKVSPL